MPHSEIIARFYKESIAASKELMKLFKMPREEEDFEATFRGEGGDMALGIDLKAEAIFFKHYLDFTAVYSEERGHQGEGDYCVVLDPIDGSDNFVSHFPYYGSSMALQYKGQTIAAMVCNLATGSFYYRADNEQAQKGSLFEGQSEPVVINRHAKVGIFEKSALFPKIIDKLIKHKLKFRSPGAVALSLVYAFEARYMLFLGKRRVFDLEAGRFIIKDLAVYEDEHSIIVAADTTMLEKIKSIVLGE